MGFFEDLWGQITEFFTSLLDTIRVFLEDLFDEGDE